MVDRSAAEMGFAPEATQGQVVDNLSASYKNLLQEITQRNPELAGILGKAVSDLLVFASEAKPGIEAREARGMALGVTMMTNKDDTRPFPGTKEDASEAALFLQRARNKVGIIDNQGVAEVKIALNPTRNTTQVSLPK